MGFGGFTGFNNKKRSSLGGDFDGDGVKNLKDCEPMNRFKQGPEHEIETREELRELRRKQRETHDVKEGNKIIRELKAYGKEYGFPDKTDSGVHF